jgi:hypothetical protein
MQVRRYLIGMLAMVASAMPALAHQTQVKYNLAAGATSAPINVPAVNTPVSITCVQNSVGFRGVGQVTMLRVGGAQPLFLEWVGMDIATSAITSNFSNTAGAHIIYCDYTGKTVDMQVLDTAHIQIVNTSSVTATGVINFIW